MIEINDEQANQVKNVVLKAIEEMQIVVTFGKFSEKAQAGIAIGLLAQALTHISANAIPNNEDSCCGECEDEYEEYNC